MTRPDFGMITKKKPEKRLLAPLPKTGARNKGKVSVRFRGGGAKRMYRIIEFAEKELDVAAKVLAIEYDPNRSGRIALVEYEGGKRVYVLAPQDLAVGSEIIFSDKAVALKTGNRTKLKHMPVGTFVYNIELVSGRGGEACAFSRQFL